ncbi:hypothetical protein NPIL_329291 [Nephila pilipes]|uniref:Uncharacterized protein n=1 Tax=Nephila pilipes TaxID=299642 RepID=A0A8X6QCA0_NEPPI|nr:hypothetical protein NPIL_329291 [Nephila pilipes]
MSLLSSVSSKSCSVTNKQDLSSYWFLDGSFTTGQQLSDYPLCRADNKLFLSIAADKIGYLIFHDLIDSQSVNGAAVTNPLLILEICSISETTRVKLSLSSFN